MADSELVVELQRHGTVRGRASRTQRGGNQRALGDFLPRRTCSFGAFYVHFNAVGTLGRESDP